MQNYEAHTRLMAGVNNFLALIAERSGLLLDPDEGSYFLIVPEVLGLPSAISHISGLRLQGYSAGRDASQVEREIATRTAAEARSALQQVALHLDAAFAADADLREVLEEKARAGAERGAAAAGPGRQHAPRARRRDRSRRMVPGHQRGDRAAGRAAWKHLSAAPVRCCSSARKP